MARHLQAVPDRPDAAPGFPSLTEGKPVRFSEVEPQRGALGLDRLSVSFPLGDWCQDDSAWMSVKVSNPGTANAAPTLSGKVGPQDGPQAFVGASYIAGNGQWWGKVEFNPARWLDPEGHSLCPVEALPGVVEEVMQAAGGLVAPLCPAEDFKVKRLDVARDFGGIHRPEFYLDGLSRIPRAWARRNLLHADPSRGGAQTLMVGSGAGVVRLYDKHAETSGKVAAGTLRWESECRSGWLKNYGGIDRLSDLDGEKVQTLGRNRWEWSAVGVEVNARSRVVDLVQQSGLSPAKQRSFLGWLMMQAAGVQSPLSNDARSDFRRIQRSLGVSLAVEEPGGGLPEVAARLDWETGREVIRVA